MSTAPTSENIPAEWRRGWPIVVTGAIGYGTGLALFNITAGLFIHPMQEELGWTVRALSIAPFAGIVMALFNPFVGMVVDRYGARGAMIFGQVMFASCLVILALAPATPFAIYSLTILLGAISPLTNIAPIAKGVASWFRRNAGMAIGLTLNGISLVSLFAVPLVSAMIIGFGWRAGYLTLAGMIFLLGLPAIILGFRERRPTKGDGEAAASYVGADLRDALADARFWGLLAVLVVSALPLGGFITHLVPILRSKGFDMTVTTSLATLFPVSIMIGRIGGGFLLDRFSPGMVAAVLLAVAGDGAMLMYHLSGSGMAALAVPAVLLLGTAQGAEADFVAFFTLRFFGLKAYSTIVGIYAMAIGLSMAAGGLGYAELFDRQGDYQMAIMLGAGGFIAASALMLITWFLARRAQVPAWQAGQAS